MRIHSMSPGGALLALAAVLLAPIAAPAGEPAYTPPPIEAYTRLPHLEEVAVSPDGGKIAYIGQVGDHRAIIVQPLAGQVISAAAIGDDLKVRDVQWGDGSHVLITTAKWEDDNTFEKADVWQTVSFNIATKKSVTLLSRAHQAVMAGDSGHARFTLIAGLPFRHQVNGRTVNYVAGYDEQYDTHFFVLNLDTGAGVPNDDVGRVQDASGKATVREEGYWNDTGGTYTWRLSAKDTKGWRELWRVDGNKIEAPELVGRGRAANTVFVRRPEEGDGVLYEVSLATGARKKLTFEGSPRSVDPLYNPLTDDLVGYQTVGGSDGSDLVFLDPAREAAWESVAAAFPAGNVTLSSHSDDFTKLIIFTTSSGDPGTYWMADTVAHKAYKIGGQYPGLTPRDVARKTLVTYTAADGMKLYAYLTLPVGREPRGLPLIVLPHGGPQSRDDPDFDWFSQVIASRGYAVLQPQFRGSEGWGRDYFMAGQGQWGRKMQTDLSDGVHYLVGDGTVDAKRVCIFGWSYGGYAALAGATLDKGVYRCAAAGAPVSDLRKMLSWERGIGGAKDSPTMRYEKRYMGVDNVNDPALDAYSPALLADRVTIPILLIHGKEDTTVPYAQSTEMADALKRAGKPYDFVTLDKEDHHLSKDSTRRQAFGAIIPFLEKHNPPYP
jgi:dipeptidyl aminopeptidase/acylaminoacyl peptidase